MTPVATEHHNSSDRELLIEVLQRVSSIEGQLTTPQTGFIAVANIRMNDHSKKLSRHDKFFMLCLGGGMVILWLLNHFVDKLDKIALVVKN